MGIKIYQDRGLDDITRFVPITSLGAPVIVSRFTKAGQPYIVSMSCDKEGHEPEYWLSPEAYQGMREENDEDATESEEEPEEGYSDDDI